MQVSSINGLPEAARQEWRALETETDPQLFWEEALHFAQRQESEGRFEAAAELYAAVVREAPGHALANRAQSQLDAILGRGSFGPRAEFLLRNLAQQASEPTALLAMGAAGAVFRLTRLATLSRLAAAPNPGTLTQLLGAGRLASLAGFALEAPTFTLVGRLGGEALGRSQDWNGSAVARDLASSYLVLGGLKLAGWGSGAAYRRVAGIPANGPTGPLQTLFQQAGMFSGILLGHGLEEWTGLRHPQDGATTLVDSLAMLLQFNVAGRLSHHAFGPRFAAWERSLDVRADLVTSRAFSLPSFSNPGETLAVAGGSRPPETMPENPSLVRNPRVLMMVSGNGGQNGGNDGKGDPPGSGRRPTMMGLGTPPIKPATVRPVDRPEVPLYSEAALHPIQGLSPFARRLNLDDVNLGIVDINARLCECLDQYFEHYRDPVVIDFGSREPFSARQQGMFKVDLHRLFREYKLPEDLTVTLLMPSEKTALQFRRQNVGFGMDRVVLKAPERRPTSPARPAVKPSSPGTTPATGTAPADPKERVNPKAPERRPTSPARPAVKPSSPGTTPATGTAPADPKERVDPKAPERRPTSPARPAVKHSPPRPTPATGTAPADPLVSENFEALKTSFRQILQNMDPNTAINPALRLNVGRIEEKDLQDLANLLSDHPLPEGRKITIFWMERGGGHVIFQRQGELVRADWKGFQVPQQAFWLAPVESLLGHLQVFRAEVLPTYSFEPPRSYEPRLEQQLKDLHERIAYPAPLDTMAPRDEGPTRRGEILGRLSLHWLREHTTTHRTWSPFVQEDFVAIHQILESGQAMLDLEMTRRFVERLGSNKLRVYQDSLEGINRARRGVGMAMLLPLAEFPPQLTGDYILPLTSHLRAAFADQLFKDRGGSRIPLETNGLRRNPQRLGQIFREMFRSRALAQIAAIKLVERSGAGETLSSLMAPDRKDFSPYHQKQRDDVAYFLQDWAEIGRILRTGPGGFHRQFLNEVLVGSKGVRDLYGQLLGALRGLPPELRRSQRLEDLPAQSELEALQRGSGHSHR